MASPDVHRGTSEADQLMSETTVGFREGFQEQVLKRYSVSEN